MKQLNYLQKEKNESLIKLKKEKKSLKIYLMISLLFLIGTQFNWVFVPLLIACGFFLYPTINSINYYKNKIIKIDDEIFNIICNPID